MVNDSGNTHDHRTPGSATSNSLWEIDPDTVKLAADPPEIREATLPALFLSHAVRCRLRPFATFRAAHAATDSVVTWERAVCEVHALVRHLKERGKVTRGTKVAILSATRYEWLIADLAIQFLGGVSVSVYHSLTAHEVGFILWDSEATVVFAENQEQVEKLAAISEAPFTTPETEYAREGLVTHHLSNIVSFEPVTSLALSKVLFRFQTLVEESSETFENALRELQHHAERVGREDLASFVYTSGTTGAPKGVMQTHGNHLAMLQGALRSGLLGTGEGIFLYLPLAHSFARLVAYAALSTGGDLIFPTVVDPTRSVFHPQQIFRDLSRSSPVLFPSVPRLFEKVMDSLLSPEDISGRIARWALKTARALTPFAEASALTLTRRGEYFIAQTILRKIRRKIFGERLRYCISGGAPISVEVLEFFESLGVMIYEGYGLTETTPAMAANIPQARKFGTVGKLFDCNEVRIAADGEIEVRGANVAKGYWKLPKATAEAWDNDGWFRTGDIGEIDAEGFLKITDRKKDLIVTAGGKKIPPAFLEGKLKNSPLISQAIVFGDRKSYLVALITLNEQGIRSRLRAENLPAPGTLKELSESPVVQHLVGNVVQHLNSDLASFEQIKTFKILGEDFTLESGLLTPSLKLKRKLAVERYAAEIAALYQEKRGKE